MNDPVQKAESIVLRYNVLVLETAIEELHLERFLTEHLIDVSQGSQLTLIDEEHIEESGLDWDASWFFDGQWFH